MKETKHLVVIVLAVPVGIAAAAVHNWWKRETAPAPVQIVREHRVVDMREREAQRARVFPREGERFRGSSYRCTQDCSGHEAGYRWASRKGITDPDECSGNSESFIEGCRAYAEEQR